METTIIEQSVDFKASPDRVYDALMVSWKHFQFTGAKASISREVGGEFAANDGHISGTNVEFRDGMIPTGGA